jgi:aminopeptidase N
MFDSHSYSKGATILHLLRKTVGDSAFFKSLNVYLTENAYKNTEIHHLRHAFEKVTGQDLNWFFDQWFFKPGHPQLVVEDTLIKDFLVVKIYQEQDTTFTPVYRLPTEITYWIGGEKKVEKITIDSSVDIFKIKVNGEPELVVIDEHGLIPGYLYYINSPNKFYKKYINMYKYSNSYNLTDLALKNLYKYKDSLEVIKIYREALSHPFWKFQITAIEVLEEAKIKDEKEKELIEERIIALAKSSKNTDVRAQALQYLASKNATLYREIFETALKDSSYTVQSNALLALIKIKTINRDSIVNTFKSDDNSAIIQAVSRYFAENGDETCIDWFQEKLKVAKLESKYYIIQNMGKYLAKTNNLNQQIGIKILLPYAKTHQYNWIRYAAFEALYPLVKTHPTLKKELLDIKKEVKSESLKKALEKFKL